MLFQKSFFTWDLPPGGDERGEEKYMTDTGHGIFAVLDDDAQVLQCQIRYWAQKMQYNVQVSK